MGQVWEGKSPEMQEFLAEVLSKTGGYDPRTGVCATCGKEVDEREFYDDLSRKEYMISGMCQACQDSVFDVPDDEDEYRQIGG